MKHQFKFFFLLSFFFVIKQTSFSQGVIYTDRQTINTVSDPCIIKKVIKHEGQNSSNLLTKPDCNNKNRVLYSISIKSYCQTELGCDNLLAWYDCSDNNWYITLSNCEKELPFNGSNIATLNNKDSENRVVWEISLSSTSEGLLLGNISPCLTTITIEEIQFIKIDNCNTNLGITNSRIQSHPNPTTGLLDLQFEGVKEGTANIQVYNNIGTLVQEIPSVSVYQGKNNTEMDLSNLPAGLYNIIIRQGETAATQRIQKL